MNIEVKLSMEKAFENSPHDYAGTRLASGYIEIESAFKFPVSILRGSKDGSDSMFVKFPALPRGNGTYSNVVFPVDAAVRKEVEDAVFQEFRKLTVKGVNNPPITDVRVTVLPEPLQTGNVSVHGYASIMISGFAVNGISIKESGKGLFVQMPQYRDGNGQYHDIVYGTNTLIQEAVKQAVLEGYRKQKDTAVRREKQVSMENKKQEIIMKEKQASPKL